MHGTYGRAPNCAQSARIPITGLIKAASPEDLANRQHHPWQAHAAGYCAVFLVACFFAQGRYVSLTFLPSTHLPYQLSQYW